jgi:hypothetical protein
VSGEGPAFFCQDIFSQKDLIFKYVVNFIRIEVYASTLQSDEAIRHHKMLDLYPILPQAA